MKKILCLLFALLLLLPAAAPAEEDGELPSLEEEVNLDEENGEQKTDGENIAGEVREGPVWDFPLALEDMNPEHLILANKQYLLDKDYFVKPLVKMKQRKANKDGSNKNGGVLFATGGTYKLSEVCAEALVAMSEGARADGCNLYLKSAYRSWQTQNTMYRNRLKKNKGRDDGWVSKAGASDHQTGLGCDVVPRSWRSKAMNEKMAKEKECKWMAEHCQEYGFILRYPEDKQEVTGINYEPWHMRYVGNPAATYIMENGLCLEEFTEQLQQAISEYLATGGDRSRVEAFIQKPTEE